MHRTPDGPGQALKVSSAVQALAWRVKGAVG